MSIYKSCIQHSISQFLKSRKKGAKLLLEKKKIVRMNEKSLRIDEKSLSECYIYIRKGGNSKKNVFREGSTPFYWSILTPSYSGQICNPRSYNYWCSYFTQNEDLQFINIIISKGRGKKKSTNFEFNIL